MRAFGRLLFGLSLKLYPRSFRLRYERDLRETFADQWGATGLAGRLQLLAAVAGDALRARRDAPGHDRAGALLHAPVLDGSMADLRAALRGLLAEPVFSAITIATLALAIGASVLTFAFVQRLVLAPLPYPDADELVMVSMQRGGDDSTREDVSLADALDWNERARQVRFGLFGPMGYTMRTGEGVVPLGALVVTPELFEVLQLPPLLGRTFVADDLVQGAEPVVVLSHDAWTRYFGASPDIVGATADFTEGAVRVIGVLSPRFRIPQSDIGEVDVYGPLTHDPAQLPRAARWLKAVGRLLPTADLAGARTELQGIVADLATLHPTTNEGLEAVMVPMIDAVVGPVRTPVLALQFAVIAVLLIACVNVANLLLGRMLRRRRELAVRTALGSGRWRLVRQALAESSLLTLCGGAAGVAAAALGLAGLEPLLPPEIRRVADIGLDLQAMLFAGGLTASAGLLFGTLPALLLGVVSPASVLQTTDPRGGRRQGLRSALVVAEVALAFALLVGASLMVRTLAELMRQDLGVDPSAVLSFQVAPDGDADARIDTYARIAESVAALPGVIAVAASSELPLTASDWTTDVLLADGVAPIEGSKPIALYHSVTPGYFAALGARIVAGRDFDARDHRQAPGAIIVNEAFVRRYLPQIDPLGQPTRIDMRFTRTDSLDFTIVGVVADMRDTGPDVGARPSIYVPAAQQTSYHMLFVVRTNGDPTALAAPIRRLVTAMQPDLAVDEVTTLEYLLSQRVAGRRFAMTVLSGFAGIALVLAALGIYGVLSALVTQRQREIGVRMALGARGQRIVGAVVRDGLMLVAFGLLAGGFIAWQGARLLAGLVWGVEPGDATVWTVAPLILTAVGLIAAWVPARRATRVDPAVVLRAE